jgi:5-methyltetrahydrofolate--homocysteine methyltransferase
MKVDLKQFKETVWISDGAWGTELQKTGLTSGECPEEWNVSHPDAIRQLVRRYLDAGSQIVLTNTFGGSRFRLKRHHQESQVHDLNVRGARLVKETVGDAAYVFASMGPSGQILMTGDITQDELYQAFTEQAKALAEGGADAIAIETMSDLEEASIALRAVRHATALPTVVSMSYDSGPDKTRTMMGVRPEQAAARLAQLGADIIGANCGAGIEHYAGICRKLRSATSKPLWVKPNNGLPERKGDRTVYRQSLEDFLAHIPKLVEAGANIIGGCCGTTPDHVRGIRRQLESLGKLRA